MSVSQQPERLTTEEWHAASSLANDTSDIVFERQWRDIIQRM